eukprot:TRINITY_DN14715_c0_g2_i1.p1 TRINITY_DN14715_c0_g2~~TRINITY_DN14715_c0_g2_i1.p1  ORF type:complete len:165 (+),score=23.61 TRINITY_DN14715_c0_g2_i1:40-534(+)
MGGACECGGVTYQSMDNFEECKFTVDGETWISSEQYYQAMKFEDKSYREKIRTEPNTAAHWKMGQTKEFPQRPDWSAVKVDVMYKGNFEKFSQNENFRKELISTSGPIRAFGFSFWKTWNSIILRRIREELKPPSERNEETLARLVDTMRQYRESGGMGEVAFS